MTQPYTQQLGATNRISLAARISGIVFLVNVMLNLLLIPEVFLGIKMFGYGAVGAAIATLLSICIGSVLFRVFAYRITKSVVNIRVLLHFAAAAIMGSMLLIISQIVADTAWYWLLLFALIGAAIYLFVLTAFREFTSKDYGLFLRILNPIQLINYARREVKSDYVKDDIGYENTMPKPS
jgi:O-antigen/teichoic acid export membrane protein